MLTQYSLGVSRGGGVVAEAKYHLPDLKVRQYEVGRFRKSACPLLWRALLKKKNQTCVATPEEEEEKRRV